MTLSEAVRQEAKRKGASQSELAARLGCSRALVSRFMKGECRLSSDKLERMASILGVRIEV